MTFHFSVFSHYKDWNNIFLKSILGILWQIRPSCYRMPSYIMYQQRSVAARRCATFFSIFCCFVYAYRISLLDVLLTKYSGRELCFGIQICVDTVNFRSLCSTLAKSVNSVVNVGEMATTGTKSSLYPRFHNESETRNKNGEVINEAQVDLLVSAFLLFR